MIRGLYAAASGMMAQMSRQDVYANNLANANSVGFRRGQAVMGQFSADLAAVGATGGAGAQPAALDLTEGPLTTTNRNLDLAISGNGFFVIQTPKGLAYTRDGRFALDSQNRLVNSQGYPVLGTQGRITVPSSDFTVDNAGQITCKGQIVGKLRVVTPVKPRPLGNSCFAAAGATAATGYTVSQGMLEQANVNPVQEMARMLEGYRYYEANASALRYQDESLTSLMKVVQ